MPNAQYKDYLDHDPHDEFDAWLAAVVNPWHNTADTTNWDSADRLAAMDHQGVCGEVIFPNTLPPFFDVLAHLSGTLVIGPSSIADGPGSAPTTVGWSTSARRYPTAAVG